VDGTAQPVPLYARDKLVAGLRFGSPCVIAQSDCTTCVPGGFTGRVDAYGNVILTLSAAH
jgi:N-methylhydantoinase A